MPGYGVIQTRTAATESTEFLIGSDHQILSGTLEENNGTNNFEVVQGATALGEITASGKLRPCAVTRVDGAQPAVNLVDVDETGGFLTGDVGSINSTLGVQGSVTIDGDGATTADIDMTDAGQMDGLAHIIIIEDPGGTLGVSATIDGDGAAGAPFTITSLLSDGLAHAIIVVDPGANDQTLSAWTAIAAGVETTTVLLETGGGGAIASTVAEVIGAYNAASKVGIAASTGGAPGNTAVAIGSTAMAGAVAGGNPQIYGSSVIAAATGIETLTIVLEQSSGALQSTVNEVIAEINASSHLQIAALAAGGVGGNTAAAVASTPLAGAIAVGGAIASARTITVTSATELTFSGGAFTVAADDQVTIDNGADTCVGFSVYSLDTYVGRTAAGVNVNAETHVSYVDKGAVLEANLNLVNDDIKADLPLISFR